MSAITATIRRAALDYLAAGATYTEAADRFGVSRSILSRWWRQEGMPRRRSGPRPTKPHQPIDSDIAIDETRWVRRGLIWHYQSEGIA